MKQTFLAKSVSVVLIALMLGACSEGFQTDVAVEGTFKTANYDPKLKIDISAENSQVANDYSRGTIVGTCHPSSYVSHLVHWEIHNAGRVSTGAEPNVCQNGEFEFVINLADKNLQTGVITLVTKLIGYNVSGKAFESAADSLQFTVTGSGSGGGTGGGGGAGGCSDPYVDNFCRAGGSPQNHIGIVQELARQYSQDLYQCGRNSGESANYAAFIRRVVVELRRIDQRWGFNWVRGGIGDANGDVIGFYYGPGAPQENSPFNVIMDIVGDCGDMSRNDETVYWGVYLPANYAECCNPSGSTKWTLTHLR